MKVQNRMICSTAVAALALLLGSGVAFAQYDRGTTPPNQNTTPTTPNSQMQMPQTQRDQTMTTTAHTPGMVTDKQFVRKAAEGNMAEVKLGELANRDGTDPSVKDFGKRMVDDHTKANDQLKDAAAQSKIAMPTTLSKTDQATYDRLSKLSGKAFDRAYARDMVRDHEHDIAAFKAEARDGKNANIKGFASQTVPTLESHLTQARQMLKTVGSTTTTRTGAQ